MLYFPFKIISVLNTEPVVIKPEKYSKKVNNPKM